MDFAEVYPRARLDCHRIEVERDARHLLGAPSRLHCMVHGLLRPAPRAAEKRADDTLVRSVVRIFGDGCERPGIPTETLRRLEIPELGRHPRAHEQRVGPPVLISVPFMHVPCAPEIGKRTGYVAEAEIRLPNIGQRSGNL